MSDGDGTNHQKVRCHYDVLGVDQSADDATIKKAHRRLALQYHPDKNDNSTESTEQFRLIQQAYECLSDPAERKWYDEHREAILRGWSATSNDDQAMDILFDIVPYMYAGCFSGYDDTEDGFFAVYQTVFTRIRENEQQHCGPQQEQQATLSYLGDNANFGSIDTPWEQVSSFYQAWESFTSGMNYAWHDTYDIKEAPNRRVRRAMEEENRKARRAAKKSRTEDILALVRFVKRRDPRVKAARQRAEDEKARREQEQKERALRRTAQSKKAKEAWRQQAEQHMAAIEEEDRLAGRLRLADLDDDYDYGGKKGKKGKKKKKSKNAKASDEDEAKDGEAADAVPDGEAADPPAEEAVPLDATSDGGPNEEDAAADNDESEEESSVEPDGWRCEVCRKDFKSAGQMENHMRSKKHKQAVKRYEDQVLKEMLVAEEAP